MRQYTLLFLIFSIILFYPGNFKYFHISSYYKELFAEDKPPATFKSNPVPMLKAPYYPAVTAEGVYIVDFKSFTPVFQKNAHIQLYPASTAKIITALVAIDLYDPDDIITIKTPFSEGQLMNLVQNEQITVENLLYGTLVHSGNDAAYALADHYGLSKFVGKMNEKAQSLHMNLTHFTNPAGLDNNAQLSSAFDLAIAARELIRNPYLLKIVSTKEITISDINYQYYHKLINVNKLLGEVQGVGGLKTGFTDNAGENLISFYKYNNHEYILVILKSQDRFEDTKEVIRWINTNIEYHSFN